MTEPRIVCIGVGNPGDCAWCGGEILEAFLNRRGEAFCSKSHRDSSGRALRRFEARQDAIARKTYTDAITGADPRRRDALCEAVRKR